MATTNASNIVVVLNLQARSITTLLERVNSIATAMGDNKTAYPSPNPSIATVLVHVAALVAAQTALKNHTGSREARDDAKRLVVSDAGQLHGYVQMIVNADPSNAELLAQQAGMSLRKKVVASKPALAVHQTVSGMVHVVAKATKGARVNEWQYSTDGGKTFIDVPPTTKASVTITGLQPGTTVTYRQRPVTKTGRGDWSQPISALVI